MRVLHHFQTTQNTVLILLDLFPAGRPRTPPRLAPVCNAQLDISDAVSKSLRRWSGRKEKSAKVLEQMDSSVLRPRRRVKTTESTLLFCKAAVRRTNPLEWILLHVSRAVVAIGAIVANRPLRIWLLATLVAIGYWTHPRTTEEEGSWRLDCDAECLARCSDFLIQKKIALDEIPRKSISAARNSHTSTIPGNILLQIVCSTYHSILPYPESYEL